MLRHVQLKGSRWDSKTARQNLNVRLELAPAGVAIWLSYRIRDDQRFSLGYRILDNEFAPLCLQSYPVARHTKGNSAGHKNYRPDIRVVAKRHFTEVEDIDSLASRLFGKVLGIYELKGDRYQLAGAVSQDGHSDGAWAFELAGMLSRAEGVPGRNGGRITEWCDEALYGIASTYADGYYHKEIQVGRRERLPSEIPLATTEDMRR